MLGSFRKNLGVATIASTASFAISLALTPVMTRCYQPSDYGTFAVVNNAATFLATAFLLSLPNALPVELSWPRRAQLLRALLNLTVIAVIASTIGVGLALGGMALLGRLERSEHVLATIPVLVLAIALHRIAQNWANADGAFTTIAIGRVVHPLVAKPLAIGASLLTGASPLYMVAFEGLAMFVQAAVLVRDRFRRLKHRPRSLSRRRMAITWATVKRYKEFSLYLNVVGLLSLGAVTLQTMIVASAYSVEETGLFSLAMSIASLPVQLISMATAPVVYHRLIACARDTPRHLFGHLLKILVGFVAIGSLPYLLFFVFGPEMFAIAFGSKWDRSGALASVLACPLFLQFLYTPISSVLRVTATVRLQFTIDMICTVPVVAGFYVASRTMVFMDAAAVFAVALSVHQLASIASCLYVSRDFSRGAVAVETST